MSNLNTQSASASTAPTATPSATPSALAEQATAAVDSAAKTVAMSLAKGADQAIARVDGLASRAVQRCDQGLASARRLGEQTQGYIRQEPLKSVAMAAAGGALLLAAARLLWPAPPRG
ncbi:hypothetical protein RQP53_00495 [Paucibacter sp. APW11]|uniref:DUF883 domain-containing protein n=1 Tax=Roseateles aquae TaxID=3077235 RepID=A0ABU3P647_9BURK|nr:hypothetical protein [Paucibacter sp. APW11]MDT8997747.1 hypothetical protein [Paucibacter sp. APW11]